MWMSWLRAQFRPNLKERLQRLSVALQASPLDERIVPSSFGMPEPLDSTLPTLTGALEDSLSDGQLNAPQIESHGEDAATFGLEVAPSHVLPMTLTVFAEPFVEKTSPSDPPEIVDVLIDETTAAGTEDDDASPPAIQAGESIVIGNVTYFVAYDTENGCQIWMSYGTEAEAKRLTKLMSAGPGAVGQLTASNDRLFFTAVRNDGVTELWCWDGVNANRLAEFRHTTPSLTPRSPAAINLMDVDGLLYFVADDGNSGMTLWKSDGTSEGTWKVQDSKAISSDENSSYGDNVHVAVAAIPNSDNAPIQLPLLRILDPLAIVEGIPLHLTAFVDRVDALHAVMYWDLNHDGVFADAKGDVSTLVEPQVQDLGCTGTPEGDMRADTNRVLPVHDAPLEAHGTTMDVVEGQKFNRVLASFRDPGGLEHETHYTARIAWGDGETTNGTIVRDGLRYRVAGEHCYATHGLYQVQISLFNGAHELAIAESVITVRDAAIYADRAFFRSSAGRTFTGMVASFQDANPLGRLGDFAAEIDWGDGSTTNGLIESATPGVYRVIGSHVYQTTGSFTLEVRIRSNGGNVATAQSVAKVYEARIVARGLTSAASAFSETPRALAAFTDSDRDAKPEWFSAEIDWGDAVTPASIETDGNGGFRVIGSRPLGRPGVHSVKVTIRDRAGNLACAIGTVRVIAAA